MPIRQMHNTSSGSGKAAPITTLLLASSPPNSLANDCHCTTHCPLPSSSPLLGRAISSQGRERNFAECLSKKVSLHLLSHDTQVHLLIYVRLHQLPATTMTTSTTTTTMTPYTLRARRVRLYFFSFSCVR